MERTLVIIKPDGVQRQLAGRIINRFEEKGLKIAGLKLIKVSQTQADTLYSVHKGKPFHSGLVKFITSSPVVVIVIEAVNAISICRKLLGATMSANAEPGTIRGDFGSGTTYNLVHGSDSPESVQREIPIFFNKDDLVDYELNTHKWIYSGD
jgi:nucleoside-diphosphate kinase